MYTTHYRRTDHNQWRNGLEIPFSSWDMILEALLGVLGIRYIYPKYFSYEVLVNIDFWV